MWPGCRPRGPESREKRHLSPDFASHRATHAMHSGNPQQFRDLDFPSPSLLFPTHLLFICHSDHIPLSFRPHSPVISTEGRNPVLCPPKIPRCARNDEEVLFRRHFPVIRPHSLCCHFDRREKSYAGSPRFLAALGMTGAGSFPPYFVVIPETPPLSFRPSPPCHFELIFLVISTEGRNPVLCPPRFLAALGMTKKCYFDDISLSFDLTPYVVISTEGRNPVLCPPRFLAALGMTKKCYFDDISLSFDLTPYVVISTEGRNPVLCPPRFLAALGMTGILSFPSALEMTGVTWMTGITWNAPH